MPPRPETGRRRPGPSGPRQSAPSCWQAPPEPASAACGEKRTHQLDGISRPYRLTCPDRIGLRLEDGKRIVERIQRVILYDQVDEIIRESRVCPDCASVRAIHDYRTRDLDTLFGRVRVKAARAAYAVLVMPGQRRCSAGLFLSWPISFHTGLPGAAAAPCTAWVLAFLSRSRAADEQLPPLPSAPSHHGA